MNCALRSEASAQCSAVELFIEEPELSNFFQFIHTVAALLLVLRLTVQVVPKRDEHAHPQA